MFLQNFWDFSFGLLLLQPENNDDLEVRNAFKLKKKLSKPYEEKPDECDKEKYDMEENVSCIYEQKNIKPATSKAAMSDPRTCIDEVSNDINEERAGSKSFHNINKKEEFN